MNTPSNVMAESPSAAIAPVDISSARRLYWLVARELWENRAVYVAPLIVAAVFLAGFLIGLVRLPDRMRAALALSPMQQHEAIEQPFLMVALILMFIEILVAIFYCLDAFVRRAPRSQHSLLEVVAGLGSRRRCSRKRAFRFWCCRW